MEGFFFTEQRKSSLDELDTKSALTAAETDVNPKRFSTPSLLENLPLEVPEDRRYGSKVDKVKI